MPNGLDSHELLSGINPDHLGLLHDSLRAPSAHNAQPWQIKPLDDGLTYELHYNQSEDLPEDHDDKDAYLTMGALAETMVLQGPNHGLNVTVTPELTRNRQDLFMAKVAINNFVEGNPVDPLSAWVGKRVTNRSRYQKDPLPEELEHELEALGNVLLDPKELEAILVEASVKSWANPRFVQDLKRWFRKDEHAPDGLTASLMRINKLGTLALDFAFWRGSLKSTMLGRAFSSSEVAAFNSAPKAAVLTAEDMSPPALFDAGRRLLRSWVAITAAGYSYQPYSVAVDDRSTAPKVGEVAGTHAPVALYRIGKTAIVPPAPSNRRPLVEVLI